MAQNFLHLTLRFQLLVAPLSCASHRRSTGGVPGILPRAPGEEAVPGDMTSVSSYPGNARLPEKLLELVVGIAHSSLQPAVTCSEVKTAAGNFF